MHSVYVCSHHDSGFLATVRVNVNQHLPEMPNLLRQVVLDTSKTCSLLCYKQISVIFFVSLHTVGTWQCLSAQKFSCSWYGVLLTVFTSRPSRYQLWSSRSNQLVVPPVKLSTHGPRSFAVAAPTVWSNLPEYLRAPELSVNNFRRQLKTFLSAQYRK